MMVSHLLQSMCCWICSVTIPFENDLAHHLTALSDGLAGIQLADFGTSHKLGSIQGKFAQSFYDGGWNMPGTLFAGGPDPLGLTRTFTQGGETYEGYKAQQGFNQGCCT